MRERKRGGGSPSVYYPSVYNGTVDFYNPVLLLELVLPLLVELVLPHLYNLDGQDRVDRGVDHVVLELVGFLQLHHPLVDEEDVRDALVQESLHLDKDVQEAVLWRSAMLRYVANKLKGKQTKISSQRHNSF